MKNVNFRSSADIADWCYLPLWKRSSKAAPREKKAILTSWLVFVNDAVPGNSLVKKLMENRQEVTIVKAGNGFEQTQYLGSPGFAINPRAPSHYETLLEKLDTMGKIPDNIIHCWNVTAGPETVLNRESFDNAQYLGFYSMMYLVKAIAKQKMDTDIRIFYLANGTQDVMGTEPLCPEKVPVLGLLKSFPQELSEITCRSIDIRLPEPGSPEEESLIDLLMEEFSSVSEDVSIAYRDNQRWVQFFDTYHLPAPVKPLTDSPLKKQGVYLVTGGLGTVGLIFSEFLVEHAQARLILTDPSAFPGQDQWDHWLNSHDDSDPTALKIKHLLKLREMGGDVLYIQADTADPGQMKRALALAESTFGKINGVIHAAYVAEGNAIPLVEQVSASDCQLQFQPKVYGALVLEELFKNENLDFCWMISSLACVLGGLGLGAYAGANTFMDLFIKKHNRSTQAASPWFSLNWDIMDAAKAAALFERIFHLEGIDQLVMSRDGNLQERIDQWIKLETLQDDVSPGETGDKVNFKARPQMMNPYAAPGNELEQKLTEIWQRLFGFDRIGIDDNFGELGGDSLTAINLTAQIKKHGSYIALTDVLANPTIRQLAAHITEKNRVEELMAEVYEDRLLNTLDCIEKLNKTRNKPKIFIFHPGHGMLNQYKELGQELAPDFNVYGIQARGAIPGSKMSENVWEMLDDYTEQILKIQPEGPFIFAGLCAGVLISYEITRRFEAMGHTVRRLILFDGPPYFTSQFEKILKLLEYLPNFSKKIIQYVNKMRFKRAKIKKERYEKEHNVYESDEKPGQPGVSKRLYNHIAFTCGYIFPVEIIKAPILVTRSEESEDRPYTTEEYNRTTKSKAVIKITPGDHDTIFEKPYVESLAKIIRSEA